VNVTAGTPRSLPAQLISITRFTALGQHFVYVRARDGAGNWSTWTQLSLTVTGFAPFSTEALPEAFIPGTAPLIHPKAATAIVVRALGHARLVSVSPGTSGKLHARFVFSPRGISFRGTKTIVRGRNAAGRIVLTVQVRGNARHGYRLRAVSGNKHSLWLSLANRSATLEAVMRLGERPTLNRALRAH
jgi:hypothetical protein